MDIYFYNNHSPANVVDKILVNETIISGTLKEDVEILNPVITISKQMFDFNYNFNYAIIELPNGKVVEGAIDKWTDYDDGDQIQVTISGVTYLVHSTDCVLISK